ncbi:unnamed protein product [Closterium sp. NIES-64]|nr:unnamed protein product [Closterium sp. NIES-64]
MQGREDEEEDGEGEKEEDSEGSGDDSEAAWDPETHGGGEGGDDEDHEMDGLEPEGREEEVGEGGGRGATEAGSQHVREGGGSVGVMVGGKKAVTIREPRQRKKANKLRERAYPCTFTGEPLGEGVIAPEFLDEDGGSESSKGTGKGETFPRGGYKGVPDGYVYEWPHAKTWPQLAKGKGKAMMGGGGDGSGGIERWMTTKLTSVQLRQAITKLVVTCDLPFRIVEAEAFRELLILLNRNCAQKNFIPSRWTVSRDTVVYAAAALQSSVAEMLAKEGEVGCRVSFTIDMWTAPNDNASSNTAAFRWMSEEGGGQCFFNSRMHFRCLAHVINLAVKAALAVAAIRKLLRILREMASWIGFSPQRSGKFLSLQRTLNAQANPAKPKPALKLVQDSPTRWGSTHDMVERAGVLQEPITVFFAQTQGVSKTDKAKLDTLRLTDADWETLHSVKTFLSPFAKVSKAAEGAAYPTVAMVLPYYNGLIDAMESRLAKWGPLEGRHAGDKTADELEQVIGEWALGGGEFFGVTMNNAENNNRAVRLLAGVSDHTPGSRPRDPPVMSLPPHFKCVAHVLNLAVQYAMEVEPVAQALRRLRAVASHIGWSVQRSERFFDIQRQYAATRAATQAERDTEEGGERHAEGGTAEGGGEAGRGGSSAWKVPADLRLIVDSDSGWGSTLEMVPNITKATREAWAAIRLSDAHWSSLSELRACLEPFYRISLFVEGSLYPTMGSRPVQPGFEQVGEPHGGGVSDEAAIDTFLDPRLKTATFRLRARGARTSAPIVVEAGGHARGAKALDLNEERVKALVHKRLPPYQTAARAAAEARVGGEVTSAVGVTGAGAAEGGSAGRRGARSRTVLDFQARLFADLAEMEAEEGVGAQDEVDQYLAEARQKGGCSLAYWRGREQQLPGLKAMARVYLGIPAMFAASERTFSQSRNIIWWQRHRLSPQQMRVAMMIKTWQDHHRGQRLEIRGGTRTTLAQLCLEAKQLGL